MLLEICASTYQSAINAQNGGGHRIELCEDLAVGGVTPSHKLIKRVVAELSIMVYVLIRPRGGNFVYSEAEFDQMKESITFCKSVGCQGIVSGVLNSDNTIDVLRTKELIERSKPMSFTFHRAFDDAPDLNIALQELITLGANRILASGKTSNALEGIETLKRLKQQVNNNLIILPGGGVRSSNALAFKKAGFQEIHSSAITNANDSDLEEIQKIMRIIDA